MAMAVRERANYFYCVRVTDPNIHENIEEALHSVVEKEPKYEDFRYTREMLHVTLCEVSLQSEEDICHASKLLQDCRSQLRDLIPTTPLTFQGISDFHEKVMIAKVGHGDDFLEFAGHLRSKAKESGVNVIENHDFNPHMTILKVSGMKAKKLKIPSINPWVYVNLKETMFGVQPVLSVHLCKMGKDRRSDGFYVTPSEIML